MDDDDDMSGEIISDQSVVQIVLTDAVVELELMVGAVNKRINAIHLVQHIHTHSFNAPSQCAFSCTLSTHLAPHQHTPPHPPTLTFPPQTIPYRHTLNYELPGKHC